jgi:hypothetical protein
VVSRRALPGRAVIAEDRRGRPAHPGRGDRFVHGDRAEAKRAWALMPAYPAARPEADRSSFSNFFVFLQENSSSSILAKEFGKCNIPETQ